MGENKHIEELDAFAKKYVKEIPAETPSANFTVNLMKTISQLEPLKKTTVYKPLISKKIWLIIAAVIVTVVLNPFGGLENKWISFPKVNLSFLEKVSFPELFDGISVSNTTFSIAALFFVMLSIQIYYLKGYFEKRINN